MPPLLRLTTNWCVSLFGWRAFTQIAPQRICKRCWLRYHPPQDPEIMTTSISHLESLGAPW